MRLIEHPAARTAFLVVAFSMLFAGDAWRMTFGWVAFGVLAVLVGIAAVVILVACRADWRIVGLPFPLLGFLALTTLSLAWSFYPAATALGLLTTWMITLAALATAIGFRWEEILRGLSITFKIVLAVSLAFELVVAAVIRAPILPLFAQPGVDYSAYDTLPKMLYWSRNELFGVLDAGRIQGIVGNANNLGLIALIALMVFVVELIDRRGSRRWSIVWIALAVLTLLFTRSATITVALTGMVAVALAVLLVRRAATPKARIATYSVLLGAVAAAAATIALLGDRLLGLLGKSSDLTGRLGIWNDVVAFAQQRPGFGWGWVSFWVPWAEPFTNLTFRNGVRQLQAHNAWVDLFFQLGVIVVVVFAALVVSALVRAWWIAVDRPQQFPRQPGRFTALSALPLLIMVVLVLQSLAESRLLVECGFALLVIIAVKTKTPDPLVRAARLPS
jgi:exopolysaccharide production protein ExoQ